MTAHIGFTGTREGMPQAQYARFIETIDGLYLGEVFVQFHHGDCVGSDSIAHDYVARRHAGPTTIHIHPPLSNLHRAFCHQLDRDWNRHVKIVLHPCADYLERNHDIVEQTEILVATPKEQEEVLRSGTWSTIRYAQKLKRRVIIIYPTGTIGAQVP